MSGRENLTEMMANCALNEHGRPQKIRNGSAGRGASAAPRGYYGAAEAGPSTSAAGMPPQSSQMMVNCSLNERGRPQKIRNGSAGRGASAAPRGYYGAAEAGPSTSAAGMPPQSSQMLVHCFLNERGRTLRIRNGTAGRGASAALRGYHGAAKARLSTSSAIMLPQFSQMMMNYALNGRERPLMIPNGSAGRRASAVPREYYGAAEAGPSTSAAGMPPQSSQKNRMSDDSATPSADEQPSPDTATPSADEQPSPDTATPSADEQPSPDTATASPVVGKVDPVNMMALPRARSVANVCLYDDDEENGAIEYELLCVDDDNQEQDLVEDLPSCPPPRPRRTQDRPEPQPVPEEPGTKYEKEERYRMIRNHFAMVLHAYQCRRYDFAYRTGGIWLCSVPNCMDMKQIVNHLIVCRNRVDCRERLCLSTRQIIAHWLSCSHTGCPICLPLPVPGTFRKLERTSGQV